MNGYWTLEKSDAWYICKYHIAWIIVKNNSDATVGRTLILYVADLGSISVCDMFSSHHQELFLSTEKGNSSATSGIEEKYLCLYINH